MPPVLRSDRRMPAALADYPRDMTVPEIFGWYAAAWPQEPAILEGDGFLSYGDLDRLASQLARRLMGLGVEPGSVVGTLTNRSSETLVAWLAILKCGCAYLPLDPALPTAALEFILTDGEPVLILGEGALLERHSFKRPLIVRDLEAELDAAQAEDAQTFCARAAATDPAYIMYTSGSTGQPKGVLVAHRGIVRLVRDQNYMDFTSDEVFLLVSTLAFDAVTWEVWGALLNGGRVGIVRGARLSADDIARGVREFGVTSIFLTSALFNMIVDVQPDALAALPKVLVGGDVMSPEHVTRFLARFKGRQLINGYGPTEATTFSVCFRLPLDGWSQGPIPIGVPIAHSRAYILDDDLHVVPDGEVGQLWVAGDGVALGYLRRPELTRERFKDDPFVSDGSRMYLTGDLARRRPDGLIECLGRNDRQVKIEGKRIELDEIEHALRRDSDVADAVVALRQPRLDDKRIVAFLKPANPPAGPDFVHNVIAALKLRVAEYMAPSEVHVVDAFPLTPNGKVDRVKLLALGRDDGRQ